MALSNDYVTAEPLYEGQFDIRIQKIGDYYRAFKRTCFGASIGDRATSMMMLDTHQSCEFALLLQPRGRPTRRRH